MKKSLRIALVVVILASLAPFALAVTDPGGTIPHPLVVRHVSTFSVIIAAFLSSLGL